MVRRADLGVHPGVTPADGRESAAPRRWALGGYGKCRGAAYDPSMVDRLREVMDGTSGHFWPERSTAPDLGYVRLRDDGLFHLETLKTDWSVAGLMRTGNLQDREFPSTIPAATHAAGCVFFDTQGYSENNVIAATRASILTYKCRGVLVGLDLTELGREGFSRVLVTFPGVIFWSGLGGAHEEPDRYEDGRLRAYSAKLRSATPLKTPKRRGITLSLASRWSVNGPQDRKVLSNPLAVTTESARLRPWHEHARPIIAVQNLINLAYDGFVPADVGTADIDLVATDNSPRSSPQLWTSELMQSPKGTERPNMNKIPMFNLRDLRGIKGVDGWIELDRKFPRATGPIANIFRFGNLLAVETRLTEVAVAIDYWINVNTRATQWAKVKTHKPPYALAKFVGPVFAEFVGDIKIWSKLFRDSYDGIKHIPGFEYDPTNIDILVKSGEILLACALLRRASGNPEIVRTICDNSYRVGQATRKLVSSGHV